MKVAINRCYGGFGLSDAAMEKLIEYGVPVRKYETPERDPETGRYAYEPDEEVIYDRSLTPRGEDSWNDFYWRSVDEGREGSIFGGRYWDTWTKSNRTHPLVIRVIEELGEAANGPCASLEVVEIPDGIDWYIDEYDGVERINEQHRSWG